MHIVNASVLEAWNALSDDEVIAQVLAEQTALFEVLMRRHNERLYRAVRSILRDGRAAEEVMERAYLDAYARLRQFAGDKSAAVWLTELAIKESFAHMERREAEYARPDASRPIRTARDSRVLHSNRSFKRSALDVVAE